MTASCAISLNRDALELALRHVALPLLTLDGGMWRQLVIDRRKKTNPLNKQKIGNPSIEHLPFWLFVAGAQSIEN